MNLIVSKISAWHEKTCQWNLIVSKISDCHEKILVVILVLSIYQIVIKQIVNENKKKV